MHLLDTNVLVHAVNESSPAHEACNELLERSRVENAAWFLTWSVIYEFLRVVTHPRVLRHPLTGPQAWARVREFLLSPSLSILVATQRHTAVASEVIASTPLLSGNLMHDAHTAILMREHGVRRIYTRDTDFHRFPFLEPIDPLAHR